MTRALLLLVALACVAAVAWLVIAPGRVPPVPSETPVDLAPRPATRAAAPLEGPAAAPAAAGTRTLSGRVLLAGREGKPLVGLPVVVVGTALRATTDPEGGFLLAGVATSAVRVRVDHPDVWPTEVAVPADATRALTLRCPPALRAWFRLRTSDGKPVTSARLGWKAIGGEDSGGATSLVPWDPPDASLAGVKPPEEGVVGPLRLRGDRERVDFEATAEGYATWTYDDEPPPAAADRIYEIQFVPLTGRARVRIEIATADGKTADAGALKPSATLERSDGAPMRGAQPTVGEGALWYAGLPAGEYRVTLSAPGHGSVRRTFEVPGEGRTDVRVALAAEAKVRVRALHPEGKGVLVRLLRDGVPATGYVPPPEGAADAPPAPLTAFPADAAGTTISGLAPGTYAVEVLGTDIDAPTTTVIARAGETTDVEVRITLRAPANR